MAMHTMFRSKLFIDCFLSSAQTQVDTVVCNGGTALPSVGSWVMIGRYGMERM